MRWKLHSLAREVFFTTTSKDDSYCVQPQVVPDITLKAKVPCLSNVMLTASEENGVSCLQRFEALRYPQRCYCVLALYTLDFLARSAAISHMA
jgi:hypothetical protein